MDADKKKEIMDKVNNPEILLMIEIENIEELYDFILDYELYGDYLNKMFVLCEENIDYMHKNYRFIKSRSYITPEVVHTNLDFDEPVPFINRIYDSIGIEAMTFAMSSVSFSQEYNEKLIELKKGPSL